MENNVEIGQLPPTTMDQPSEFALPAETGRPPVQVPDHELLRVIGRGSYGEVWEACNLMGTRRAVKVVRRDDFDDVRPFEREFEGIKHYEPVSRSHAGLVKILHVGIHPEQEYFYYVMELADPSEPAPGLESTGYVPRTLRGELMRRGAIPVPECVEIGLTLASALSHLHSHELVHRDVKPANIIIVAGAPQLADVGLVANLGDSGTMVGTEGYSAPEGGNRPGGDVFSLGKVLYECVTGLDRVRFPDVPESWGEDAAGRAAFEFMEVVLRAAEANPERRYSNMDEMLADLSLIKAGKSVRHLRRIERRLRRALQVLVIAVVAVAMVGGAWLFERYQRSRVERAERAAHQAANETRELLGESLLAEARAVRLSGKAGAREMALAAVARGGAAGADRIQLRSEAASALALTDIGRFSDLMPAPRSAGAETMWSEDGGSLVSVAPDGTVQCFERRGTGNRLRSQFSVRPGASIAAVSHGAHWLALTYPGRVLAIWDLQAGSRAWEAEAACESAAMTFSRDGSWLIYSAVDGLVARACDGAGRIAIVPGARAARRILLAPDGTWLATLAEDPEEFGFTIYTGLPGALPPVGIDGILTESKISSTIRLEGPSVSADSHYLAAAVSEDRVRVWEISSCEQIATLRGHQRSVRGTAFHPSDPSIVASTSWDGTTRLWSIPTRTEFLVAPTGGEEVILLPERGEIMLRTWNREAVRAAPLSGASGMQILMVPAGARPGLLSSVSFSPDGHLLVAAGDTGIIVWDLGSGQTWILHGYDPQIWRDAAFSPDGTMLWCSGLHGVARHSVVRDPDTGEVEFGLAETIDHLPSGHIDWLGSSDRLVVGGYADVRRGGLRIIDRDGGTASKLPSQFATDRVAVSPDGRWIAATRYPEGGGVLWDLAEQPPKALGVGAPSRSSFAFLSKLSLLAIGTDQKISFLPLPPELESGRSKQLEVPSPIRRSDAEFVPGRIVESAVAGLVAMTVSPTGVSVCDAATLAPIATLDSPLTCFDSVLEFSPDGKRLALAGGVNRVVIWEIDWIRGELAGVGLGW